MGFSSQWNFGRKMHSCPQEWMNISSMEGWFLKLSCWLSRRAMQQLVFSMGHTGEHLVHNHATLNPCSWSTRCIPFSWPLSSVIFWTLLWCSATGLDLGMTVSCCLHCFLLSDLFILKALSASGGKDAWVEDWSKMKSACFPRCKSSKTSTASAIWARSWSVSHHASPWDPG